MDFAWKPSDRECVESKARVLIAADGQYSAKLQVIPVNFGVVIYDNTATSAFLAAAAQLLQPLPYRCPNRVLYVASERRSVILRERERERVIMDLTVWIESTSR
jgi:hypothetical protein